jgi:hypothetical protein
MQRKVEFECEFSLRALAVDRGDLVLLVIWLRWGRIHSWKLKVGACQKPLIEGVCIDIEGPYFVYQTRVMCKRLVGKLGLSKKEVKLLIVWGENPTPMDQVLRRFVFSGICIQGKVWLKRVKLSEVCWLETAQQWVFLDWHASMWVEVFY